MVSGAHHCSPTIWCPVPSLTNCNHHHPEVKASYLTTYILVPHPLSLPSFVGVVVGNITIIIIVFVVVVVVCCCLATDQSKPDLTKLVINTSDRKWRKCFPPLIWCEEWEYVGCPVTYCLPAAGGQCVHLATVFPMTSLTPGEATFSHSIGNTLLYTLTVCLSCK